MTATFIDKARANRRAALASLNARTSQGANVVSIFDRVFKPRVSMPEFHSTRAQAREAGREQPETILVPTNPVAA